MQTKEQLSAAGSKGRKQLNHRWTEEDRAIIRRDYKGTNASARVIAERLGVTLWAVKGQAAKLGILQQKSPPWTASELKLLESLIHHQSVQQIAKQLHRSPNAIKIKATRLKLKLRVREGWYTKVEVSEICGVDHRKVQQWIDSGALKASWHHDKRPCNLGAAAWHIETADLKVFIIEHSGELLGRNVDIQQIVWLLTDNV